MIKSFRDFVNESVLNANLGVVSILKKLKGRLAKTLLTLIGKDIETPFNGLDLTDKTDYLSFMTDKQYQAKLDQDYSPMELFSPNNNLGKIGKIFASILRSNNIPFTQAELEKFVIDFKSENMNRFHIPVRLVRGEEMKKWFLESNFTKDAIHDPEDRRGTTLGRNCMKYDRCQDYFDIYVDNPEVVEMIIFTQIEGGEEKLRARSLVWKTNIGIYLERIYSSKPEESKFLENWAKKNLNILHSYSDVQPPRMIVKLKEPGKKYDLYPYLDSFPYYDVQGGRLLNYEPLIKSNDPQDLLFLQQDDGSTLPGWVVFSDYLGHPLDRTKSYWSDEENSWMPQDISQWDQF